MQTKPLKNELLSDKPNKKPNLFIVGAPKCATSALYSYLSQHPDIFFSKIKEPNFFASDLYPRETKTEDKDLARYLSLFEKAQSEKYIGEASTWYLYSEEAASKIKKLAPSAKIIIMLRNPVDVTYSLHSQLVYGGIENITDFQEALNAEEERKLGLRLPNKNLDSICYKRLIYTEIAKFYQQVKRYFNVFGAENVHVITFEDFKKDPGKVYREVLSFLGLNAEHSVDFRKVNANKVRRFDTKAIQQFRNHPLNLWLVRTFLPVEIRRLLFRKLARLAGKINTKYVERISMDASFRQSLQKEFAEDIENLSLLLQRDLTSWLSN